MHIYIYAQILTRPDLRSLAMNGEGWKRTLSPYPINMGMEKVDEIAGDWCCCVTVLQNHACFDTDERISC
jgi:hypothetical protein